MNVLISSGGTRERIDAVRSITNASTGALGSLLADAFAAYGGVERIFYIAGPRALLPQTAKAEVIPIADALDLEQAVRKTLAGNTVDAAAHCMAVSDFRVSKVTTVRRAAEAGGVEEAASLDRKTKIPSGLDDDKLILVLEENPKIIPLFKHLSPHTLLVGFKLLDGVPHKTLIEAAYALLKQNRCTFVLANDAQNIRGDAHTGYLVDAGKNIERWDTKAEIAVGIAAQVMNTLRAKS
ncbi:MAG: phosphopantothenoylcysteine synthase [Spirochaetaceae bacterium]|jgi:phosphopantothenate-cysteine ligase|nr:phosphopantothenoylcysteine synthase [Spirochaetaceae bacterium]